MEEESTLQRELCCNHTGTKMPFEIKCGLDRELTLLLEKDWAEEKAKIIGELLTNCGDDCKDEKVLVEKIKEYSLADMHWRWTEKALSLSGDEYEWFYLVSNGKVQGVCIIFHPKPSRVDGEKIFYVDYIAAAYWNRPRPGYTKQFSGVGTTLISFAINYAIEQLGYRPGFCLHSLPSSEEYYVKLGMKAYELDPQKEDLRYFEAEEACALLLREAA